MKSLEHGRINTVDQPHGRTRMAKRTCAGLHNESDSDNHGLMTRVLARIITS